jgi:hypothetical protein
MATPDPRHDHASRGYFQVGSDSTPRVNVASNCEICGSSPVEDGCDRCGRLVCPDHFDERTGLCTACLAEFGEAPSVGDGQRRPDGVDEYRF